MNVSNEYRLIRRAKMTGHLYEAKSADVILAKSSRPTDLAFYGAVIFGICAAVLVCLSNTPLVWPFFAPCIFGMIIGVGLVAADQFSIRSRLIELSKYFGN